MKVLVVGSNGFLGLRIVLKLRELGFEVFETSRISENSKIQFKAWEPIPIKDLGIDLVVNAAGAYRRDNVDINNTFDSNLGICTSIARSIVEVSAGVINLGSYFELTHDSQVVNSMSYTISKRLGTSNLNQYCKLFGKKFTQVILYDNYDIDLSRGKILDNLIISATTGTEIEINNIKSQVNLLHVSAVVNGVVKIIESYKTSNPLEGRVDLMSSELLTIEEIIKKVEKFLGKKVDYLNKNYELDANLQALLLDNPFMLENLNPEFEIDDFLRSLNKF